MQQLSFKIADYEGPLDLILQLIAKHKLNIYDIEISQLLEQYRLIIRQWQQADMDISSEFLEMLSRLVYMKSVSLLPRQEEIETLKSELSGQLIEYSLCKQIAQLLRQLSSQPNSFVRQPLPLEQDASYSHVHHPSLILQAYLDAVGRYQRNLPPKSEPFEPLVAVHYVSVKSKIAFILNKLHSQPAVDFITLFHCQNTRSDLVAAFLAVLELLKDRQIRVSSDNGSFSILHL